MTVATGGTSLSTSYEALLAELGDFNKSMTADAGEGGPAKVEAAAAEAGAVVPDADAGEGEGAGKEKTAPEGENEGDETMKSFQVTLPDGSVHEMLDAEPLLKSLQVDVGTLTTGLADVTAQLATATAERDAALRLCTGLLGSVKQQGEMLKSLSADVAAMGNKPVGRRAMLAVAEPAPVARPAAAVETGPTMDAEEFFAKAMTLLGTGAGFSARDISLAEARMAKGLPVQADLAAAVAKLA